MPNFSDRLKNLRKLNKLNQSFVANLLGVSQNQVSRYEKAGDMPPLEGLIKLTNYFGVTLDYLLGLTSNNDIEKVWTQILLNKRLSLFTQPDGQFEFPYFHDGKEKKSIFTYSFGILPIENTDFKPTFLVIHEKEGTFLELATGYEKIKAPEFLEINEAKHEVNSHDIYIRSSKSFSKTNLPFLGFINFLNSTFLLGYRLDKEPNGLHRIQLITTLPSSVPALPNYAEITSGSSLPVTLKEVFYSKFLNDNYLPLSCEEKAKFLEPYIEEAFKW